MSLFTRRCFQVLPFHRFCSLFSRQRLIEANDALMTLSSPSEKLQFLQTFYASRNINSNTQSTSGSMELSYNVAKDVISVRKHFGKSGNKEEEAFLDGLLVELVNRLNFRKTLALSSSIESCGIPRYSKLWICMNDHLSLLLLRDLESDKNIDLDDLMHAVHFLNKNGIIRSSCCFLIAQYLSDHLARFDIAKVLTFLYSMTRYTRHDGLYNSSLLLSLQKWVLSMLYKYPPVNERPKIWGERYDVWLTMLLEFYASLKIYDEKVISAVVDMVYGPYDPQIHRLGFLATVMNTCSSISYVDNRLCDLVMNFFISNLKSADLKDIKKVLQAFVLQNYNHLEFLDKVVNFVSVVQTDFSFVWMLMWSSLYHNKYYQQVLDLFLCDTSIEDHLQRNSTIGTFTVFLRLLFSLTIENPHLNLRKYSQSQGVYPYQIEGINDHHALHCLEKYLTLCKNQNHIPINSDIYQALLTVTNECICCETATLIGYTIDFELLVKNGIFHKVPNYLNSKNFFSGLNLLIGKGQQDVLSSKSSLNDKYSIESSTKDYSSQTIKGKMYPKISLATDWMKYFNPDYPSYKRIAIEFDGPTHFAINNKDHRLGMGVVKMRQLKAMGWHILVIPFHKWDDLENEKERLAYINAKLWEVVNES